MKNNPNREALLKHIMETGFAAYDALLYLDTHQEDPEAMEYYRTMVQQEQDAMAEYGRLYGPLTADCAYATADGRWQWACQPWPWEGGGC